MDAIGPVSPDLLMLARTLRGLSQAQLAAKTSIAPSVLSRYEAGITGVTREHADSLADALSVPHAFLFLQEHVVGLGKGHVYHRKRQDMQKKVLNRLEADMNLSRIHIKRLCMAVVLDEMLPFPRYDIEGYRGDAAHIARLIRASWNIPSGPIRNLTALIEQTGCIVMLRPFNTRKLDGLNIVANDLKGLLYLNSEFAADRQRFTLAHELGHMIMHTVPSDDAETEANTFAAELLMPAADIAYDLSRNLQIDYLMRLKEKWRVSIWALTKRAFDLDIINERQYQSLCIRMTQAGYRSSDPLLLDPETPHLLSALFKAHVDVLGYQLADISKLLVWKAGELIERYSSELGESLSQAKHKIRLSNIQLMDAG
jgi:Zn-dependent peptidase ImmA (M78 family)/transcriptional regulator with XRE-family HTH domain